MRYIDNNSIFSICDFGGGYGRLSIPLLYFFKSQLSYCSIDYVPLSLLIAPQFVGQVSDSDLKITSYKNDYRAFDDGFHSVPAWAIENIEHPFDIFVSVHSFQEMTQSAVDYYIDYANKNASCRIFKKRKSYFYSINLWPEEQYVPNEWELLFDNGFPVNRDGNYNEKMWEIR